VSIGPTDLETDPRFPSGPWVGFWLQKFFPRGRHATELRLTFQAGAMTGEGRDWVGAFLIRGRYQLEDGRCHWTKRYLGRHDVFYSGFNEGKGIWGTWEIGKDGLRGGFHIWPEGLADPTSPTLAAEADLPVEAEEIEEAVPALGTVEVKGCGEIEKEPPAIPSLPAAREVPCFSPKQETPES
jgi:hypothetical protein